jgi:carbonic anhydrase
MGAHLVHRAADGELAIVALLFVQGAENLVVQTFWNHLPLEKGREVAPPNTAVDLGKLLPEQPHYLTYLGSLTAPPCSEGVRWIVLRQPVAASQAQIDILDRLYPANARPVQPANGRLIKESR